MTKMIYDLGKFVQGHRTRRAKKPREKGSFRSSQTISAIVTFSLSCLWHPSFFISLVERSLRKEIYQCLATSYESFVPTQTEIDGESRHLDKERKRFFFINSCMMHVSQTMKLICQSIEE